MKKTLMGLLLLSLILSACTNTQAVEGVKQPFIFVKDTTLYLELGSEVATYTNEEVFMEVSNPKYFEAAQFDTSAINKDVLGTYPLNVTFTEESGVTKKMYVDVVVRDTTAPTLEVKNVAVTEGDAVDINSFIVSNEDKQTTELSFTSEVDLTSVGSRDYTIASVDASGNTTEKGVNITVEAKPVVNTWTPSNSGGGSTWTPPANNGGGSGTVPAPTPGPVAPVYDYVTKFPDFATCEAEYARKEAEALKNNARRYSGGCMDLDVGYIWLDFQVWY